MFWEDPPPHNSPLQGVLFGRVTGYENNLKKNLIREFSIGAFIGVIVSILIIVALIYFFQVSSANQIKVDFLKPMIGIFILWYLFLKGPKKERKIKTIIPVGTISGLSSIFVGATGPLIAPFFLKGRFTKENIIANKAACQTISHIGKIPFGAIWIP